MVDIFRNQTGKPGQIQGIFLLILIFTGGITGVKSCSQKSQNLLDDLSSPVLFKGDSLTAYRDPAVIYHKDTFFLYFTLVETEKDGKIFSYTAMSTSTDLQEWSAIKKITPRDQTLNYCSPGNVIRYDDQWVLCLQTYPRPNYAIDQEVRYGDSSARIFIMRSKNLKDWGKPELLKVKGNDVPREEMGRMIDAYLVEDKDQKGKWWCFYKQNGASISYSTDLKTWTYFGNTEAGENATVLVQNDEYVMFHSPSNGMGIKKSKDLVHWEDWGSKITLGQENWEWAQGRISAATVTDLRDVEKVGKYVMFFHGSGPKTEEEGHFDRNASLGIAWSEDLKNWQWPGKGN